MLHSRQQHCFLESEWPELNLRSGAVSAGSCADFSVPVNAGWSSVKVMCSLRPRYANAMYFVLRCCVLAGQLAVGTCEIVMLNRDSSIPRRTIARQTARCACRRGQIAGTTRARPACVDGKSLGQISRFTKKKKKKDGKKSKHQYLKEEAKTIRGALWDRLFLKVLFHFPELGPASRILLIL